MLEKFGIILLDSYEIIINIYALNTLKHWRLIHYQCYDLQPFHAGEVIGASQFIETIASKLLIQPALPVDDWKICARNIQDIVLQDISVATGITCELLTLNREQELLCKGLLLEV